jgi:hypothetical protein
VILHSRIIAQIPDNNHFLFVVQIRYNFGLLNGPFCIKGVAETVICAQLKLLAIEV